MRNKRSAQLDREIADALSRPLHAQKRREPYIPDGRAKGRRPGEFDPQQLRVGTDHEMEHTTSRRLAQQIAMDHLAEDPLYYVKLAQIEEIPGAKAGRSHSSLRSSRDVPYARSGMIPELAIDTLPHARRALVTLARMHWQGQLSPEELSAARARVFGRWPSLKPAI